MYKGGGMTDENNKEIETIEDVLDKHNINIWYNPVLIVLGVLGIFFGLGSLFKNGIFARETVRMLFNGSIYAALGAFPLYYKKDNVKLIEGLVNLGVAAMYIWAFVSGVYENGYFIGLLFCPVIFIYGIQQIFKYKLENNFS